jgi:hypothetical protein
MTVQCAKCGEELMGSVNRCWRCGQEFVARSGDASLPPIRRSPLVKATVDVWVAELSEAIPTTIDVPVVTNVIGNNQPTSANQATKSVRRGSPFADRGTATLQTIKPESVRREHDATIDREARYQKNGGAAAGAVLAIPLGLISLLAAFLFPLAGFPLALLGLGFGVWGLNSRGRALAVAGLLICCLSLAIATFYGSVEIYTNVYGVTPWESDASLP